MKRTWLWWSSGKDSVWALHVLRLARDVHVTGLVTTVTAAFDRVAIHGVRTELLRRQAAATGLPLRIAPLPFPCSNEDYEQAVRSVLREATEAGLGAMAFGDLFLGDVREYRERLLAGSGIAPLFPLWGRDTAALAREIVNGGVEAYVTCLDPKALPEDRVGLRFDHALLEGLPAGVDLCGENGEFHTCVLDAPVFAHRVDATPGEVVRRDGYVYADLVPERGAGAADA